MICLVCIWQPIYLNLQLRTSVSGNEPAGSVVSVTVTADRDDDDGPITDLTTNRHARLRQVISVNGQEEFVEDINIHDFTTFEQEELIGSKFVRKLKRKSAPASVGADVNSSLHHLSSFKSAVRVVLTTETILEAMKHYNHRSDTETEDDDDVTESPQFDARSDSQNPPMHNGISESADLPVFSKFAAHTAQTPECDSCQGKTSEPDTAVDTTCSPSIPLSIEKPDEPRSPTLDSSVGLEASAAQLNDTEAVSRSDTQSLSRGDASSVDAVLSSPAVLVVDNVASCEDVVVFSVPASEADDMRGTQAGDGNESQALLKNTDLPQPREVDTSEDKVLLKEVDLSRHDEVVVSAAANDADDNDTAKLTDGQRTAATDQDTCCRCCSVQWIPSCMLIGEYWFLFFSHFLHAVV